MGDLAHAATASGSPAAVSYPARNLCEKVRLVEKTSGRHEHLSRAVVLSVPGSLLPAMTKLSEQRVSSLLLCLYPTGDEFVYGNRQVLMRIVRHIGDIF
jgi:hypothetical protein